MTLKFANKNNTELILCLLDKYWCLKGTSQVVNADINPKAQNDVVGINESYSYRNTNCDQFTQDYGTNKIVNSCQSSTANAYLDTTAIALGRVIQGSTKLQKCGSHWCRLGGSNVVTSTLGAGTTANVIPIANSFSYYNTNCDNVNQKAGEIRGTNACQASTVNAYLDATAIALGRVIQGTTKLQKCSNHWCRLGTGQVVNSSLVNTASASVVSLAETYSYNNTSCTKVSQNKGLTKIASSTCYVAGNGLAYDNCEGGTRNWSSASSYCSGKGMRLPSRDETRYSNANGVPSCSGRTWTSTLNNDYYYVWDGTNGNGYSNVNSRLVRCVR